MYTATHTQSYCTENENNLTTNYVRILITSSAARVLATTVEVCFKRMQQVHVRPYCWLVCLGACNVMAVHAPLLGYGYT